MNKKEKCFVICPLWNLFVPKEGMKIENGVIGQGLEVGKLDEFNRQTCDSHISCILPIRLQDFENESEFIEEANKMANQYIVALLTKLRLYTGAFVINGQWNWLLKEGIDHDVIPSESRSKDKINGNTYNFTEADSQNYISFLPSLDEIKELSNSIVITRYHSSFTRESVADRLIDLMVMMESLFNDSPGDTTYKIVIRSSFLVSKKLKDLNEKGDYQTYVYDCLHEAYSLRSNILHGMKQPDDDEISETLVRLKNIVRNFLIDSFELKRMKKINLFKKNDGPTIDHALIFS